MFLLLHNICDTSVHSSYFISGVGVENICLHILVMPLNFILSRHQLHYQIKLCFIMAIPLKSVILYVVACIFSCDFTELTILYIRVHILLGQIRLQRLFIYVNEIFTCLYCLHHDLTWYIVEPTPKMMLTLHQDNAQQTQDVQPMLA